ncbi:hypothetical protein TCON_0034 [Astathelohania contejeani]|uniref:Uncharacterized protein n=1 Tax=Astathelohania contejeani TaxID=164912 RepID=A0ABQ7I2V5_9MICR|nr:hypothetical protein TCON_0034 [Thelohania contejeani]
MKLYYCLLNINLVCNAPFCHSSKYKDEHRMIDPYSKELNSDKFAMSKRIMSFLKDPLKKRSINNKKAIIIIESVLDMLANGISKSEIIFSNFNLKYLNIRNRKVIFNSKNQPLKKSQYRDNYKKQVYCKNKIKNEHIYINLLIERQLLKLFDELSKYTKILVQPLINILKRDTFFCNCTIHDLIDVYNADYFTPKTSKITFSVLIKENNIIVNEDDYQLIDEYVLGYNIYYVSMKYHESQKYVKLSGIDDIFLNSKKRKKILSIVSDACKHDINENNDIIATNKYIEGQLTYFKNKEINFTSERFDMIKRSDLILIYTKKFIINLNDVLNFIMNDLKKTIKELKYIIKNHKKSLPAIIIKPEKYPET